MASPIPNKAIVQDQAISIYKSVNDFCMNNSLGNEETILIGRLKTMSSTNVSKTSYQVNEQGETEKTQFLREQTECPICQGELDIFVESVHTHRIKEEARCTQCMALSRVQNHFIH